MKKGQGAIEYLMTYGWALLVIVVVGAALYASGVLNPASYVTNKCTAFTYFIWQDQKMTTTVYTTDLINGRDDIRINDMLVGGTSLGLTGTNNVTSGRRFTLVGVGDPTQKLAGDTFTTTVTIDYNTSTITGVRDSATCTGKVQ